ncbi:hypothetical protein WJX72_000395 [[Myrmecia] bisecta]|uniref:Uncharacterized protein n=1 Tax=[Myrmecia] bisecta TaxID=41462 RepID=A0AAW1PR39_9CHLO
MPQSALSQSLSQYGTSPLLGSPWPFLIRSRSFSGSENVLQPSPRPGITMRRASIESSGALEEPLLQDPAAEASFGYQAAQARTLPLTSTLLHAHQEDVNGEASLQSSASDGIVSTNAPADAPPKTAAAAFTSDVLYGVINAVVGIPTMISFTAIIFGMDAAYSSYLGPLARLSFLSSGIHQLVFTFKSTLPFAVGQVQDVGLIFLSAMASSIAAIGASAQLPDREILGTTLLTLAVSTFIVGLLITIVGRFKLATLVQYVPLPVVGGYLGYVGYFCLAAGVALATGAEVNTFTSWTHILHPDALIKLAPAAAATLLMLGTMRFARHPLALPAVLVLIPAAFHIALLAMGATLADAQAHGWVTKSEAGSQNFWEIYGLYNIHSPALDGIYLPAVWPQLPKLLALFFVVAFGSSLDVAAIQADMPDPLDYNHELKTVGLANMISGLVGAGFTGSYIFSQTIFSMRAGVRSRVHGLIIAGSEIALFVIPFSVVEYMPNFFYGALLMLFGIEITIDWLILSFRKVTHAEFVLLWATYLAIMNTSLEMGIGIGIVLATLYFAYAYARVHVTAFTVVPSRSGVVRPYAERAVLEVFNSRMASVSLSGYIFFGSSVSISNKVQSVAKALVEHSLSGTDLSVGLPEVKDSSRHGPGSSSLQERTAAALQASPRFLLLDFRLVHGLDATAAQTFSTLRTTLGRLGVELVLTNIHDEEMKQLLKAHGVIDDSSRGHHARACRAFATMEAGMQYCEEQYLDLAVQHGLCGRRSAVMTVEDTLRSHYESSGVKSEEGMDYHDIATRLRTFLTEQHFRAGEVLFKPGDLADELYIIQSGSLCTQTQFLDATGGRMAINFPDDVSAVPPERTFQYGAGSIIGTTDFFLQRPRSFNAFCGHDSHVWCISRAAFDRISAEAPQVVIVLLNIIVRTSFLDANHVWEVLERNNCVR